MSGFLVLLTQAVIYFAAIAAIFYYRTAIGICVFYAVLCAMHFLETYPAVVFFIELPFGLISPGSTVMFAGKLAFFLLLYIKEDAESMRQPVYGLLIGNILMVALVMILLFVDLIAMVIVYERLGVLVTNTIPGRIFMSLAIVLSFDQAFFNAGLHLLSGVPISAFYGGWIVKIGATGFFSLMLTLYLRFIDTSAIRARPLGAIDVFDRLTYRHRYEQLIQRIGRDALTGLKDRGQFDTSGPAMLQAALRSKQSVSLMMIDIDHFKAINDTHGHPLGDRVIQKVADAITRTKREGDRLFRYGGEEFVLLWPETPPGAMAMAERIRAAVAASAYPGLDRQVTISIGVSTNCGRGRSSSQPTCSQFQRLRLSTCCVASGKPR